MHPDRYETLREYLRARADRTDHDWAIARTPADGRFAYLSGLFSALLSDVTELVGADTVWACLDAREAVEKGERGRSHSPDTRRIAMPTDDTPRDATAMRARPLTGTCDRCRALADHVAALERLCHIMTETIDVHSTCFEEIAGRIIAHDAPKKEPNVH